MVKEETEYGTVDIDDPRAKLPEGLEPLFDHWMRDPHITVRATANLPDRHYSPGVRPDRRGMGLERRRARLALGRPGGQMSPERTYCQRPALVPMRWEDGRLRPEHEDAR